MSNDKDFFVKIDVSSDEPTDASAVRDEIYRMFQTSGSELWTGHVEVDPA